MNHLTRLKNQSQITIQEKQQISQARMLEKANALVANNRVRRSQHEESRNMWMVSSYSTPKKWYLVKWDKDIGFVCPCKAFEFSSNNICLHIAACAIYEQGKVDPRETFTYGNMLSEGAI